MYLLYWGAPPPPQLPRNRPEARFGDSRFKIFNGWEMPVLAEGCHQAPENRENVNGEEMSRCVCYQIIYLPSADVLVYQLFILLNNGSASVSNKHQQSQSVIKWLFGKTHPNLDL